MQTKPRMKDEEVKRLLLTMYGITAKELRPMIGYDDLNVYAKDTHDKEYVFKVTVRESLEQLGCQNAILLFLKEHGFPVPIPLQTMDGKGVLEYNGMKIRLITFIPGEILADREWTPGLLFSAGELVARMDLALKQFSHPGVHRELIWDLQHFPKIAEYIPQLDRERQAIIHSVLDQFNTIVTPAYANLSKGIIHNDAHQYNIVIRDGKIAGIVDFSDVVFSYHINNLAVCLAHFMLREGDRLGIAKCIFDGYTSQCLLTSTEKKMLPYLIAARLALVHVVSSHESKKDPGNAYIAQWIDKTWQTLQWFRTLSPEQVLQALER